MIIVLQRLLTVAALLGVAWAFRRLTDGMRARQAGAGGGGGTVHGAPAGDGPLVRDRICNTFLPRERALTLEDDAGTHYFCSEACRQRYRSRSPGSA